ncbi:hypothetical protein AOLI_G00017520 [Acnodon oligacanthus]
MVQEGEAVSRQTRGASVALLDWCELQDKLVIVMERPEPSKDLIDYVYDSGGYLLEEEGKVILRQLVEGMIDIHSKGVLHRDIKPENILIQMDPEGLQVYILDFGCGNVLTEDPYTSYYGTPDYTPPEFFLEGSYQESSRQEAPHSTGDLSAPVSPQDLRMDPPDATPESHPHPVR